MTENATEQKRGGLVELACSDRWDEKRIERDAHMCKMRCQRKSRDEQQECISQCDAWAIYTRCMREWSRSFRGGNCPCTWF